MDAKTADESFSDVIERLLQGRSDVMAFAGILSEHKEFEKITGDVQEEVRKMTVLRT